MTQIDYGRAAKYFLLADFIAGFRLGFKYFFAPKATLNYPHEKGPLSPVSVVSMRCAVIRMVKSVVSPVSCAKRFAPRRRSPSMLNREKMAAAGQRATTSI